MSKNFIENLKGIMKNKTHIHHSHITGEVIGYAHSCCNLKVRENKPKITVVAHNLFRLYFFLLLKGQKAAVWRTRDISVGGKNPADINFENIVNQVMFLDAIKYFQQSFGALASSLIDNEKSAIIRECEKFIKTMKIFLESLTRAQQRNNGGNLITYRGARERFHMK